MAASQHHQIMMRRQLLGNRQTWEGLTDLLEDLKNLPLDHPDVYRNRTLNRNPSLMSAFLNLRSPSGPLDSFSPEDLRSLQELPEYACLDLEELRSLPGLDPRHTLGSLGEMLEQLRDLPSSHQTEQHQLVLRINPSLRTALTNMKGLEAEDSDSGSVDGDEVGESRARSLFLASVNGAPEYLTKQALSFEMKKENTNDKMVEYLEVFLGQGVSTGQFPVSLSLMKQLSAINKNRFNSAIIEALNMFLDQHFDLENLGEILGLVIRELKDVKRNICCLLVEIMTGWVASSGHCSDLALQTSKPSAALRLLGKSVLRQELEVAAPEGLDLLYQSLRLGLICAQPGLLSTTREIMLEMILLIKSSSPVQLPDLGSEEGSKEDTPGPLQDPVRKVPRRLITTSMAFSDVQEEESSEEEAERPEEVKLMLPIHFQLEEGGQSPASQLVGGDDDSDTSVLEFGYDSDASVVVEFEKTL